MVRRTEHSEPQRYAVAALARLKRQLGQGYGGVAGGASDRSSVLYVLHAGSESVERAAVQNPPATSTRLPASVSDQQGADPQRADCHTQTE